MQRACRTDSFYYRCLALCFYIVSFTKSHIAAAVNEKQAAESDCGALDSFILVFPGLEEEHCVTLSLQTSHSFSSSTINALRGRKHARVAVWGQNVTMMLSVINYSMCFYDGNQIITSNREGSDCYMYS